MTRIDRALGARALCARSRSLAAGRRASACRRFSPSRACSTTAAATGTPIRRAFRTCSPRSASARRSRSTRPKRACTLMDDKLWDYPFIHVTGHGNIKFSDAEVVRLREYLQRGGFLHVDDNYGLDSSFRREIKRVFPGPAARRRAAVASDLSHRLRLPEGVPKIHEHDGLPARGFGIFLGDRLAVYYSFSSDLGNGWEDPEVYHDPPELHEAALRMGVNLFVYAVTSRPTP